VSECDIDQPRQSVCEIGGCGAGRTGGPPSLQGCHHFRTQTAVAALCDDRKIADRACHTHGSAQRNRLIGQQQNECCEFGAAGRLRDLLRPFETCARCGEVGDGDPAEFHHRHGVQRHGRPEGEPKEAKPRRRRVGTPLDQGHGDGRVVTAFDRDLDAIHYRRDGTRQIVAKARADGFGKGKVVGIRIDFQRCPLPQRHDRLVACRPKIAPAMVEIRGMVGDVALVPGAWVRHPERPDWGLGQVQSAVGGRITVNFEHAGKVVINAASVSLDVVDG